MSAELVDFIAKEVIRAKECKVHAGVKAERAKSPLVLQNAEHSHAFWSGMHTGIWSVGHAMGLSKQVTERIRELEESGWQYEEEV